MPTYNKPIRDKTPQTRRTIRPPKTNKRLAKHEGTTLKEINRIHKKKAEERGGFQNRVFLIKPTDN